ncbi:23S rRNA (Uracil-5-)-methyltransferase rumA, related [Eimeria tenella]|uniref:23S rRNA (Uracil-5-)-methyltransferase rumA, related n=1 Tax=Eimeria tenella TaxID=5802 RepID=U6L7R1_EIMTE|nr:23S rRNA (Uracil-5-)-methyltransferase rumA, related [Eimeria tenella]CDJ44609.1 23S rRNA (Uracil-5-)-methyltransferase rumA, related [Eimeria tenella]|eukprot:XP_013235357.1 23S rRNA (Uracil-5-)-methyltransferase rumA, related [Eimeria tenella]
MEKIYGADELEQRLCGLRFLVGPASFFQTNTPACEVMYKAVLQLLLPLPPSGPLLDVCSGAGTIALCAAAAIKNAAAAAGSSNGSSSSSSSRRVIGIEAVASAVEDARRNAKLNGLDTDVEFIAGKAEDVLPGLLEEFSAESYISAAVDPPRMGLHAKVLKALKHCRQLGKLVYVSCNCKTLVENLLELCADDCNDPFQPVAAAPVDMFPHTLHCEAVVLLARRSRAAAAAAEYSSSKRAALLALTAVEPARAAAAAAEAATSSEDEEEAARRKAPRTPPSSSASSSSTGSSSTGSSEGSSSSNCAGSKASSNAQLATAAAPDWNGYNPLLD